MALMKIPEALAKLPGLLVQGRLSFDFDGVPLIAEQLSSQKKLNLIRVGMDMILRSNRVHGLPPTILVEPTNICNLKCPLCPTGIGSIKRQKGFMSFETFQKILDDLGDVLISLCLFGFGEPFMNQEILRMIEACTAHNILTITTTNGHYLQTLDDALRIVDAGLTAMIIAIDGSTQKIYQTYRKLGDVEKVKRCTALMEKAKVRRGSGLPYTALRCVVTRENEEDLPNLERLACDLGVNMFTYKTLGGLIHNEEFRDYEPSRENMRRFEYLGSSRISRPPIQCHSPFRQPIVFWDGTVVGCECDYNLEMPLGRIGEQSFTEIWNSHRVLELRNSIRKGTRPKFCHRVCPYQDCVQDSTYLSCKELRSADGVNDM